MTQEQKVTQISEDFVNSINVIDDRTGVIEFMDNHKPMIHVRKLANGFKVKALIKIKKGKKHSSTLQFKKGDEDSVRYIAINVQDDSSVKNPYIISVSVYFKDKGAGRLPIVGVKVFGNKTPEEGATMVGEHDADEHP